MTIKDIAALAGVSVSTVSKIVNGKDEHINAQTRNRVLQIVKEYNYVPYSAVKTGSDAKRFLLGVFLHSVSESPLLLQGIMEAAQEHGYGILLLDALGDSRTQRKYISTFCKNQVDGVIWEPFSEDLSEAIQDLEQHKISFAFLNTDLHPNAYQIDYAKMGFLLTQKMIEEKHTSFGCLLQTGSMRNAPFLKGFRECLYQNQLLFSDDMILYDTDEKMTQKIIQHHFTGAISAHLSSSLSTYENLKHQRYNIPQDFSLVSIAESSHERNMHCPISYLEIPHRELGYRICMDLIDSCEKKSTAESSHIIPPSGSLQHEFSIAPPLLSKRTRFISVGSIHVDNIFNTDTFPQPGDTLQIHHSSSYVGGKGANQAIALAKLGQCVSLLSAVGDDTDATFVLNSLNKADVSTHGIYRNKKSQTGKAYIYTERNGESAITILPGANHLLMPEHIQKRQFLFRNACFCLISSEILPETVIEAARLARSCGVLTALKPTMLDTLPEELCHLINFFVPNKKEAALLCPNNYSIPEQAEYLFQKGFPTVIITLGHEGCYLKTKEEARYFPVDHSISPTDTTGGADAFIAALCSYLSEGRSISEAIQIANIAAGFCVSRQGTSSAMVDRDSLESYLAQTSPNLLA